MTFPILGGNGAVAGYQIDNSLRFNDNDSPTLTRTPSTTNRRTWTFSGWIKRGNIGLGNTSFFGVGQSGYEAGCHLLSDSLEVYNYDADGGGYTLQLKTNRLFRDVSAWYHIVFAVDTTQSTSTDRVKLYINGVQETSFSSSVYPSQNHDTMVNFSSRNFIIGNIASASAYWDGYIGEYNFIDGQQLSPTDFGEFDTDSGIWKPKQFSGSYGTNGFYLDFENSGSLGADQSGNGNNFTPTNLASTDQTTDTPTNNFATLNPLIRNRYSNSKEPEEGNCAIYFTDTDGNIGKEFSTFGVTSGKWYWEVKMPVVARAMVGVGYMQEMSAFTNAFYNNNPSKGFALAYNGSLQYDNTSTTYGSSFSNNDILQVALDMDNHLCWFGLNGTWQNSATQSEIENSTATNDATTKMGTQQNLNSGESVFAFVSDPSSTGQASFEMNFGNPPFSISSGNSDGNGYGNFEYAPPSGYLALCTQNLATELSPTINDGSAYFQSTPYTGNGSDGYAITNSGYSDLQPDFVWIKKRNSTSQHVLTDSTRGVTKQLFSSTTQSEQTSTEFLTSFDSDGFTTNNNSTGTDTGDTNIANGDTYVAWNWKANGGTTSSNTDGSITSTVQANTTAGFSIVTYTGNATAGATIGHGLGKKPDMIWVKSRSLSTDWLILHQAYEGTSAENMRLNTMALASADSQASSGWYRTAPTSSVFYVGNGVAGDYTSSTNQSGATHVAYCFADIEGYSKFGSYTGNGSTDGTFIYTGFRPAFVMTKRTNNISPWNMKDTKRPGYNDTDDSLFADSNAAEDTRGFDILSNGFKLRNSGTEMNGGGSSYIYMAFAENPFVSSSGVPVVAR